MPSNCAARVWTPSAFSRASLRRACSMSAITCSRLSPSGGTSHFWGRGCGGRVEDAGREGLEMDLVGGRQRHRALHHVLQLSHIPGPGVRQQRLHRLRRDAHGMAAGARGEEAQEVGRQEGDVLAAIAERGHLDRDDVETVIQILPERAHPDELGRVLVGGGEGADVRLQVLGAPDPAEHVVLEEAEQLDLEVRAHLGHFVEEQRFPRVPPRPGRPCGRWRR